MAREVEKVQQEKEVALREAEAQIRAQAAKTEKDTQTLSDELKKAEEWLAVDKVDQSFSNPHRRSHKQKN